MPFRPMPLLDFDIGMYKAREPYRAPPKSFVDLTNAHVLRGRLMKRNGYTKFGELGLTITDEVSGNGGADDSATLANTSLLRSAMLDTTADTYAIAWVGNGAEEAYAWTDSSDVTVGIIVESVTDNLVLDGGNRYTGTLKALNNPRSVISFTDGGGPAQTATVPYVVGSQFGGAAMPITGDVDANGTNTWTPATSSATLGTYDIEFDNAVGGTPTVTYDKIIGSIDYATGVWSATYDAAWTAGNVLVTYQYNAGNSVMGIKNFFTRAGAEYLVALDADRLWIYNTTTSRFDIVATGAWTSTDESDFFHLQPFEDLLYINNGKDAPKVLDPSVPSVAAADTDYDGDGGGEIDYAYCFLRDKGRAVYFHTSEDSTVFSNRARYTPVDDLEYAGSSATVSFAHLYADAPTEDHIVSVAFVGDSIVVLFDRSVWVLRYNGDPVAPYEWQRLPSMDGARAGRGYVSLGSELIWRGHDGLQITDGISVQPFDFGIPGFTLDWNQDAAKYSYGIYVPSERQALLTYAARGEDLPESVLAIQLDEERGTKSFSVYEPANPFHCFGKWRGGVTPTWDEIPGNWDDIDYSPDSQSNVSGAVMILVGDRNDTIYQYGSGYTDNGTEIEAAAKWARLSIPGRRSHLGWVEIIADAVDGGEVTLYAYSDYSPTPYTGVTIDLTPLNPTDEKVVRKAQLNKIANFHTLKLDMSGTHPVAVDQVVPFLKDAGPMLETIAAPFVGGFPYTFPFVLG